MSDRTMTSTTAAARGNGREQSGNHFIGVIGLGVMGENLALNIEHNGFSPAVYNRTTSVTREFLAGEAAGTSIFGAPDLDTFIGALARPRRVLLMVKAGAAVDAVIGDLQPYLEPGDILIDGGNSFFQDTERRSQELEPLGIHFVGMGVSGGEEGARWGPSLMPGGPEAAYRELEPMLTAIAAKTDSGPCVTYIGPGGSGHYVKMVHNGIEYGDMQLIAETYDIMRRVLGMSAPEMAEVFRRWNEGRLASYLIEITAAVLAFEDAETGRPLVDLIADEAEQKGTGRWTSQNAQELGVPVPTLDAAVEARAMSAMKAKRVAASKILRGPDANGGRSSAVPLGPIDKDHLLGALEDSLYFAKVSSYAQGMALLRSASEEYDYHLNLSEIARIWKGGCIIRAKLLDEIRAAFAEHPDIDNMMLAPAFAEAINATMDAARYVACVARVHGIPVPALSGALDYVDTYRQERLPANLIQAQRDFFGAHTYKRLDKPGTFHTVWTPVGAPETVASKPSKREAWVEEEGERAPRGGHLPPDADLSTIAPEATEELTPDPEEAGAKSPEAIDKGQF